MFDRLFEKIKNKWVLFALSAAASLALILLIFFLFLRGPFAALFASQGERAYTGGDYEKAVNRYSIALSLKKTDETIYIGYAHGLAALRDYEGAQRILDRGIERLGGAVELYIAKAQIYTAQGRPGEASAFLDNISNSYIQKDLQDLRPGNITFTPAQGRYGKAQKITLQVPEGTTVYYTLNGETPTTASSVYTEPITISSTTTFTALALDQKGLVSPKLQLTYEIDNANEAIEFIDEKVEKMVRAALNQPSGALYAARLASVTALSNEGIDGQIRSLKDLEYLPALQSVYIDNELLITDYSPLAALPQLTNLTLSDCGLSDGDLQTLSACNKLTELTLTHNHITILEPIRNLAYLEYLNISHNKLITAATLTEFPLLNYLDLSNNDLSDLEAVRNLKELTVLYAANNRITDLSPLAELPKLVQLSIAGNTPSNIKKLAEIPTLISLDISSCGLTSLSVVNDFPALQVLVADDNQISSLATFNKSVTELYLNRNPLVDFSPLEGRSELMVLEASGTQISRIDFLAGHPHLITLDISDTKVTDASILKTCPALNLLVCSSDCKAETLPDTVTVVVV